MKSGAWAQASAHPRACGENNALAMQELGFTGSSPRVRGKQERRSRSRLGARLIPARAGKTFLFSQLHQYGTAHPRACGENLSPVPAGWAQDGSSPRVRGKRTEDLGGDHRGGLIPARAGKTPSWEPPHPSRWAHPRACGENRAEAAARYCEWGSSPRVRGKLRQDGERGVLNGLIPARAGKTSKGSPTLSKRWAHPRACGENEQYLVLRALEEGSSPRVRGKHRRVVDRPARAGLIPARAGKTGPSSRTRLPGPAHPRACGENWALFPAPVASSGSSPRVRGKPAVGGDSTNAYRLIPARAGKTGSRSRACGLSPAHPRACGENPPPARVGDGRCGSSPRVRGKPSRSGGRSAPPGLIPARAGKTAGQELRCQGTWAHPRACGENASPSPSLESGTGSSPRVRGKRPHGVVHAARERLIPARAGKTSRK